MSGGFREQVPWWAKLSVKVVLARLPFNYQQWRAMGLFRHGRMLDPDYASHVFEGHLGRARDHLPERFTVLELGPGDSLATAVYAQVAGAARTWLVDAGSWATTDIAAYAPLLERAALSLRRPRDVTELLALANASYHTNGLASLRALGENTVDLTFSQAVLEHVALADFDETIAQLFRVQAPGGIGSHRVDLRDHLESSLNSLRFSREHWEGPLLARSGFYTNRLRSPEIRASFERAGYRILKWDEDLWPTLPLARRHMNEAFQRFTDAELRVHGVDVVVEKPRNRAIAPTP